MGLTFKPHEVTWLVYQPVVVEGVISNHSWVVQGILSGHLVEKSGKEVFDQVGTESRNRAVFLGDVEDLSNIKIGDRLRLFLVDYQVIVAPQVLKHGLHADHSRVVLEKI